MGSVDQSDVPYKGNSLQSPQLLPSSMPGSPSQHSPVEQSQVGEDNSSSDGDQSTQNLRRPRLHDLVREVDPTVQLDEDVEDMLLQLADDYIDGTVNAACALAKHRHASTVELKDVQLHLERQWNMWIPGFGEKEVRPLKRAAVTEAHKQRMALIKKMRKF